MCATLMKVVIQPTVDVLGYMRVVFIVQATRTFLPIVYGTLSTCILPVPVLQ